MYISVLDMYAWLMPTTMSVAHARANLAEAIERSAQEPVFIERRGRRAAVIISPEVYDRFVAAIEEREDVAAFDEAMAEEGANIPWAQVKADLGWS